MPPTPSHHRPLPPQPPGLPFHPRPPPLPPPPPPSPLLLGAAQPRGAVAARRRATKRTGKCCSADTTSAAAANACPRSVCRNARVLAHGPPLPAAVAAAGVCVCWLCVQVRCSCSLRTKRVYVAEQLQPHHRRGRLRSSRLRLRMRGCEQQQQQQPCSRTGASLPPGQRLQAAAPPRMWRFSWPSTAALASPASHERVQRHGRQRQASPGLLRPTLLAFRICRPSRRRHRAPRQAHAAARARLRPHGAPPPPRRRQQPRGYCCCCCCYCCGSSSRQRKTASKPVQAAVLADICIHTTPFE